MIAWAGTFAGWYWRRVREAALVVCSFALGGIYVAFLMTFPQLAWVAFRLALTKL